MKCVNAAPVRGVSIICSDIVFILAWVLLKTEDFCYRIWKQLLDCFLTYIYFCNFNCSLGTERVTSNTGGSSLTVRRQRTLWGRSTSWERDIFAITERRGRSYKEHTQVSLKVITVRFSLKWAFGHNTFWSQQIQTEYLQLWLPQSPFSAIKWQSTHHFGGCWMHHQIDDLGIVWTNVFLFPEMSADWFLWWRCASKWYGRFNHFVTQSFHILNLQCFDYGINTGFFVRRDLIRVESHEWSFNWF